MSVYPLTILKFPASVYSAVKQIKPSFFKDGFLCVSAKILITYET